MKVEINAMKEVNFQNHRNCLPLGLEFEADNSPYTAFTQPAIEIEWIAIECFE